ncbi:MAG: MBL fold metallo-hydrolase [Saprospiraceae bacterium]
MNNIEQIYTNCLAQGAYFVESEGEAFVIDPLRETEPYIQRAQEKGVKIKYIFETHFHADFVSGHIDLAKKTGATIVYGPSAKTDFDIHTATDGEEFKIGKLTLKVLHTPGHTPESSTFLLIDENGKEHCIFSGDTLFIGDVGRPDLAQKATGLTQDDLAGWLFDSLRNKIMTLPDDVIVYPAHGAGSSCGKNMSSETWDTLGNQKKTNYALRADMTKAEFIKEVTDGLATPPQYFSLNAGLNKKGYGSFDDAMTRGLKAHSVEAFKKLTANDDVMILDVRERWDFVNGYVPGSVFIGLDGGFAPWVGALITDIKQKIAIVAPVGREEEAVKRLARVGYDFAVGYLDGGYEAWKKSGETSDVIESIKVEDFVKGNINKKIIDVRKPGEYDATHLCGAINTPLDDFASNNTDTIDKDKHYFVHCRSGFRSTIASSILKNRGIKNIVNVIGSFDIIKDSMLEIEGSCPSLLAV